MRSVFQTNNVLHNVFLLPPKTSITLYINIIPPKTIQFVQNLVAGAGAAPLAGMMPTIPGMIPTISGAAGATTKDGSNSCNVSEAGSIGSQAPSSAVSPAAGDQHQSVPGLPQGGVYASYGKNPTSLPAGLVSAEKDGEDSAGSGGEEAKEVGVLVLLDFLFVGFLFVV